MKIELTGYEEMQLKFISEIGKASINEVIKTMIKDTHFQLLKYDWTTKADWGDFLKKEGFNI